ncbi:hypothetical protein L2E82_50531 [Cichorium intybus]|nr:hypothetical protein L2E82_50531 [Cichorium intybus]
MTTDGLILPTPPGKLQPLKEDWIPVLRSYQEVEERRTRGSTKEISELKKRIKDIELKEENTPISKGLLEAKLDAYQRLLQLERKEVFDIEEKRKMAWVAWTSS